MVGGWTVCVLKWIGRKDRVVEVRVRGGDIGVRVVERYIEILDFGVLEKKEGLNFLIFFLFG